MASSASATVTQANLSGTELLWSDTGSYTNASSRILTITDYLGNIVVTTSNLVPNLTYTFTIAADGWYAFTGQTIDDNGTFTSTVYFVATGFYVAAYLNQFTASNCGCKTDNCNLEIGENYYNAALRFNLAGQAGAANSQACITAANYFVNLSPVVQFS